MSTSFKKNDKLICNEDINRPKEPAIYVRAPRGKSPNMFVTFPATGNPEEEQMTLKTNCHKVLPLEQAEYNDKVARAVRRRSRSVAERRAAPPAAPVVAGPIAPYAEVGQRVDTRFDQTLTPNPLIGPVPPAPADAAADAAGPDEAYNIAKIKDIIAKYEVRIERHYQPAAGDGGEAEYNKETEVFKQKVLLLKKMLVYPTRNHVENVILFPEFLADTNPDVILVDDLTDVINRLKNTLIGGEAVVNNELTIGVNTEVGNLTGPRKVLSRIGQRKLASLMALFSRLYLPPLIKSRAYKPNYLGNKLMELLVNGAILPLDQRNERDQLDTINISIAFIEYINDGGTINKAFYESLTNGDLIYETYKQNYVTSSTPAKISRALIKIRTSKWLADDNIVELPREYIFNQYTKEEDTKMGKNDQICDPISKYPRLLPEPSGLPPSPFQPTQGMTNVPVDVLYVNRIGPNFANRNYTEMRRAIRSPFPSSTGSLVGSKNSTMGSSSGTGSGFGSGSVSGVSSSSVSGSVGRRGGRATARVTTRKRLEGNVGLLASRCFPTIIRRRSRRIIKKGIVRRNKKTRR